MRKPPGYWQNWDNALKELKPICEELGRFPSQTELNKKGYKTLARAISKNFGGTEKVAKKCGYDTYDQSIGRKMLGYWTFEQTVKEYLFYIEFNELTFYPTKNELIHNGKHDMYGSIQKHGGYQKFKDVLKETYNFVLDEHPPREIKWNFEKAKDELFKVYQKVGYIPTSGELDKMGLQSLRGAIDQRGGVKPFASALGLQTKAETLGIKGSGYWKNIENVKKELVPVIKQLGHFPSYTELKMLQRIDILGSFKYYKGIENTAILLGHTYEPKTQMRTLDGHFVRSTYEVILDNFFFINDISHETEGLINKEGNNRFMYDFRVKDLNNNFVHFEIWGYRKGSNQSEIESQYNAKRKIKEEVYKKNNLTLVSLEEYLFNKDFDQIYDYLVEVCIKHNIKTTGFNYDGNYLELLVYNIYSIQDLYEDLKPYIKENNGYMPTANFLRNKKREDLVERLLRFGGFVVFREKFKLKETPRTNKWSSDDFFLKELLPLCEKLERLPTSTELLELNRGDLLGAIYRRGGFQKVSDELGILTKTAYNKKKQ
ncbi:hypothetical protein P4679_25695 [Priestia megaterium]|uniref:hypothetical protein n=1 Tax=Priestia megaterium TaxID=1404 RepID=UPI002E22DA15|nr:hypothetical protein [Priestia megaterium]